MYMDKEEIVASYRDAKNKEQQIGILAELNVCKKCEIEDILVRAGFEIPFRKKERKHRAAATQWTPERVTELEGYLLEGLTYLEIAERMGVSDKAISYQVSSRGLAGSSGKRKGRKGEDPYTSPAPDAPEVCVEEVYIRKLEQKLKELDRDNLALAEENKLLTENFTRDMANATEEITTLKERIVSLQVQTSHASPAASGYETDFKSIKGLSHLVLCALKQLSKDGTSPYAMDILEGAMAGIANIIVCIDTMQVQ